MTEPEDEKTVGAPGHGHFRASDADREQVIDTLKDAFAHGRLTMDELGLRVAQTLASRTYAELATVTADIPAGVAAQPPPAPARAREPVSKVRAVVWAGAAVMAALAVAAFLTGHAVPGWLALFVAYVAAGTMIAEVWEQRRSRGKLPQGPTAGAGGQSVQHATPAARAGPPRQAGQAPPHTPAAALRHRSRRPLPITVVSQA